MYSLGFNLKFIKKKEGAWFYFIPKIYKTENMQNIRNGLCRHAAFLFLKAKALFSKPPARHSSQLLNLCAQNNGCGPGAQSDCAGLSNILKVL